MIPPKYASMNGVVVPWRDASIQVFTPAVKYGIGVFEGVRGYWNTDDEQLYLFRLEDHLDRLALSERAMRFRHSMSRAEIIDQVKALIVANDFRETIHIRVMTYLDGPNEMRAREPIGIAITAVARPAPPEIENGVSAQISSWMRIPDRAMPARIKANANYHNGRLATLQAVADGYDVPLMLNDRGDLAEAPAACIFVIRNGRVATPALSDDVLESITRETILRLCQDELGLEVEERSINRSELAVVDEALLIGTGAEVTPIVSIDREPVGRGTPGEIGRRIQQLYFDVVHRRLDRYAGWCMPVG